MAQYANDQEKYNKKFEANNIAIVLTILFN